MGVWIEIDTDSNKITAGTVTPCMGVWIEIRINYKNLLKKTSHSLYGSVD